MNSYKVNELQNGRNMPVCDLERIGRRDSYEIFLSELLSVITIENTICKNN